MLGGWKSCTRKIEEKDCHLSGRCHFTEAGNWESEVGHSQGGRGVIEAKGWGENTQAIGWKAQRYISHLFF